MRKEISELVNKYREAHRCNKNIYFDAYEFEELADYFDSLNEIEEVKQIIDEGLKIHPKSSSLIIRKLKIIVYNCNYEKALKIIEESALEYDYELNLLKVECFLNLGMEEEAKQSTQELLKNEDENLGEVFEDIGFVYFEVDMYDEARGYFEKSLEYNSDNLEVLNSLGYIYDIEGNIVGSIKIHNKILDIDSYTYDSWVNLGKLYSMQEEFIKAIDAFDFALAIKDNDQDVLKMKAHCLSLVQRQEEAVQIFKNLLKLDPKNTSVYLLLIEAYLSCDMYKEALEYIDKYVENIGEDENSISKRASIYIQQGDMDKAMDYVSTAINICTKSFELNMLMGEIYFRQKDYEHAQYYFAEAYSLDEASPLVTERISTINIINKNYRLALSYAEKLFEIEPYNKANTGRLALLYFQLELLEKLGDLIAGFDKNDYIELSLFAFPYDTETFTDKTGLLLRFRIARDNGTLLDVLKL